MSENIRFYSSNQLRNELCRVIEGVRIVSPSRIRVRPSSDGYEVYILPRNKSVSIYNFLHVATCSPFLTAHEFECLVESIRLAFMFET